VIWECRKETSAEPSLSGFSRAAIFHLSGGCISFSQQIPGFPIPTIQSALRIIPETEEQASAGEDCLDRQDEPGVLGDDVGDEEIYFGRIVGDHIAVGAAVRVDVVATIKDRGGGFHLDAPEFLSGNEDEVVAFTVAVGLGHAKSHARGLEGECEFGELSAALGSGFSAPGRVLARRLVASG
jgi:hypothetical protein